MPANYFDKLDPPPQKQYREKLKVTGNTDPYSAPDCDLSVKIGDFLSMCYPDIVNYLVFSQSPFSAYNMRAYKKLKSYNQVIESWVRDGKAMTTSGLKVLKGALSGLR